MISKTLSFSVGAAMVALAGTLVVAGTHGSEVDDICRPDYARSHRLPPAEYYPIAKAAYERAGIPWSARGAYTVDHVVPLCLGGTWAQSNLQIQTVADAHTKDRLEWESCRRVCSGTLSIGTARGWFADWKSAYAREFPDALR